LSRSLPPTAPHVHKGAGHREKGEDFFSTPRNAIIPMLGYIPPGVKTIWEPTAGTNSISDVLREHGYEVITTDINPRLDSISKHDFLSPGRVDFDFDCIILNPPFSYKNDFLAKVLTFGKPFLMIVPLTILETATRAKLFREHKMSIINFNKRVNYLKPSIQKTSAFFPSVWVVHDGESRLYHEELRE
jgi:hypothetical protein